MLNAITLLTSLLLAFAALIMLTKKEGDLQEDGERVKSLLQDTHKALAEADRFVRKEKIPPRVMEALDSSLCKLMCNVRADRGEATRISVLYGHFKHVLDELLASSATSHEYHELKKHIEQQYDHIRHELAALARRRGLEELAAH